MFSGKRRFLLVSLIIAIALILGLFWLNQPQQPTSRESDYSITSQAPFNQPNFYPVQQSIDSSVYRPNGEWLGRLILPTSQEMNQQFAGQDGAWIEIYNAPNPNLIGQKLALKWQDNPKIKHYVNLVTTNIQFSEAANNSLQQGNVNPIRLDGRSQVGPLQSLAGARPNDDVIVRLEGVNINANNGKPILTIQNSPTLVTGRFYGLVSIIGPVPQGDVPPACPSVSPCSSEYFQVVHYNRETGEFNGKQEIIRIPQQPPSGSGRFYSTPYQLEASPVGNEGWYIYGAKDNQGIFTVQALKPRSLVKLTPKQVIVGENQVFNYINTKNWENTPQREGQGQIILADSQNPPRLEEWQLGDKALLIHLFGGIGGIKGEKVVLGTVTGHFSYGIAEVVQDPFTDELQFEIKYEQVYAHNPAGILSGDHSWENYMGNLQRGWVFSRPISDVIVKLDILKDYNFDGIIFSPVSEIIGQLQIMTARYRTGDGTGYASVTPAASCVQDSNQALYIALEILKQKVRNTPEIINWLDNNPNHPQTLRFKQLVSFSDQLEAKLVPENVVRPDWRFNADTLAGVKQRHGYGFVKENTLANALLSWRSMLPRVSHDQMSHLFADYDAKLHFIRTNQIGGQDSTITPLAPTSLFGEVPIISKVARRILFATVKIPSWKEWGITLAILGIYALIALPIGFFSRFLRWSFQSVNLRQLVIGSLGAFFAPALIEELVMRVAWLPYPQEGIAWDLWKAWAVLGIIVFMLYHPLNAISFYKRGYPTFLKPIFLILTGLLGTACTVTYAFTGSLWTITLIHWLTVVAWLFFLGGEEKLSDVHIQRPKLNLKRKMKMRR